MNVYILEGNYERAKEIGAKILGLMSRGRFGNVQDEDTFDQAANFSYLNTLDKNNNELLNEQLNIRYLEILDQTSN